MSEPLVSEQDRTELDLLLRRSLVSARSSARTPCISWSPSCSGELFAASMPSMANACTVLPERLIRVLRALTAFGIFKVLADGIVSHTPRSHLLRSDPEQHASRRAVLDWTRCVEGVGHAGRRDDRRCAI